MKAFLFGVLGLYASYLLYGVFHERVTRLGHGEDEEKFTYHLSLLLVQCVFHIVIGCAVQVKRAENRLLREDYLTMFLISAFFLGAMFLGNVALQYLPYPVLVVGKSCKPIPVMVMSHFLFGRKEPLKKWLSVLIVCIGISVFIMKPGKTADTTVDAYHELIGYVLLLAALFLDGFIGPMQKSILMKYQADGEWLMLRVNVTATLILVVLNVLTLELMSAFQFVRLYPAILMDIVGLGVCSAVGQYFIYYVLDHLGPVTLSIATTSRKFFTILLSLVVFRHVLSLQQWLGVGLVFAGLLWMISMKAKKQ